MISCGVEISIPGGVGEMVRFVSHHLVAFFFVLHIMHYLFEVQKALCSVSYEEKKT